LMCREAVVTAKARSSSMHNHPVVSNIHCEIDANPFGRGSIYNVREGDNTRLRYSMSGAQRPGQ
jgi:hypothetical protein